MSQELTDADRLRETVLVLRGNWGVEDRKLLSFLESIATKLERGLTSSALLRIQRRNCGLSPVCTVESVFDAGEFERVCGEYPTSGRMVKVTISPAGQEG